MEDVGGLAAPYGRSCQTCVKAKCKCILRQGDDRCERCHRLNKSCEPSQTRRKRTAVRKNDASTHAQSPDAARTARLEQKLDQVLASLRPGPISPASNSDSPQYQQNVYRESAATQSLADLSNASSRPSRALPLIETSTPPFAQSRPARVWKLAEVTPSEAEDAITDFRSNYVQWFPFLYIPPSMTAEQLRNERPFLWLNIVLITSHSPAQYQRMGDIIRRELAEAMVMDSEKSLDLLLGMLVFIGWYHSHCQQPDGTVKLSLSLLTQMLISLVFDLQLNRRDLKHPLAQNLGVPTHKYSGISYPRTMEAKRAGIAVFVLSSMLTLYLQRTDSLRWTSYFEDNLRELEENPQWIGDSILAHQARLQLVLDRVATMTWFDTSLEVESNTRLPPFAFLQPLQTQLLQIRESASQDLQANTMLHLHYLNTLVYLTETTQSTSGDRFSVLRGKRLWANLTTAKTWFDIYFSIPPTHYRGFSFNMTTQIIHCMSTLYDLMTLDEPGWDKHLARAEVDFVAILDKATYHFQQAASVMIGGATENYFSVFVKFFQKARPGLIAKLQDEEDNMGGGLNTSIPTDIGTIPNMFDLEFLDNEAFWNYVIGQDTGGTIASAAS